MNGGYIKLYRSLLSWCHWNNKIVVRVYLHLLLNADWRYDSKSGREAGDVDITANDIATSVGVTVKQVKKALQQLEESKDIKKISIKANRNRYKVIGYIERQVEGGVNWLIFPRQLMLNKIYSNTDTFYIFLYLLLSADIQKGIQITSYDKLGADKQQVRKALRQLLSEGLITTKKIGNQTQIEIVEYKQYQPQIKIENKNSKSKILRSAPDGIYIEDYMDKQQEDNKEEVIKENEVEKSTANNTYNLPNHLLHLLDDYI